MFDGRSYSWQAEQCLAGRLFPTGRRERPYAMDLRIEKTYRSLTEALTALLEEKSYDKISVSQLCDRAMIRRTTFYKHFADKDEFFLFYIHSMHDFFFSRIDKEGQSFELHMLNELLSFMSDHESLVENIVNTKSSALLLDFLRAGISDELKKWLWAQDHQGRMPDDAAMFEESYTMRASLCAGGMVQMLYEWWKSGRTKLAKQAMIETYNRAFSVVIRET